MVVFDSQRRLYCVCIACSEIPIRYGFRVFVVHVGIASFDHFGDLWRPFTFLMTLPMVSGARGPLLVLGMTGPKPVRRRSDWRNVFNLKTPAGWEDVVLDE